MKLFTKAEQRYKINAHYFTIMRESIYLSVEQFANVVGWSVPYQYKLESGKVHIISEKTMKEIRSAFYRYGIDVKILY